MIRPLLALLRIACVVLSVGVGFVERFLFERGAVESGHLFGLLSGLIWDGAKDDRTVVFVAEELVVVLVGDDREGVHVGRL